MTTPVNLKFTIFKGGQFEHRFKYVTPDELPIDITGWTARMQIKDVIGGTVLINSNTPPMITVDGVLGLITLIIPASVSSAILGEEGVFDVELVAPDTVTIYKLAYGKVKFISEVTT